MNAVEGEWCSRGMVFKNERQKHTNTQYPDLGGVGKELLVVEEVQLSGTKTPEDNARSHRS